MSWHIDEGTLERYVEAQIGEVDSDSIEAHLMACDDCRRATSRMVDVERRDRIWGRVCDRVDQPTARRGESILRWFGLPTHTARLVALTPAISASWLSSVVTVLVLAVLASQSLNGDPIVFLVMAPLVPVVGVVVAFRHPVDPLYEVGMASPTGGFYLVLVRATAVLAASLVVTVIPSLLFAELRLTMGWLLPAFLVTVLTLVLATMTEISTAAVVVSTAWVAVAVVLERAGSPQVSIFGAGAQLIIAAMAAALVAVLFARRNIFERL